MGFMMFLAVPGLVCASAIFGFGVAGLREEGTRMSGSTARTLGGMLFVMAALSLVLISPAAIQPAWLQYGVLLALPVVLGFVSRRVVATRMSRRADD